MKAFLKTLPIGAICALALSVFAVHAATDAVSPQGLLKGKLPDNAAALKRVVIGSFTVQYVTDFGVEKKRGASNTFYSKLKDVPSEVLQTAADALNAQLVAELQAAGVEVVPASEAAATPAMLALKKVGMASPLVINDSSIKKISTLVGANGLPIVLLTVQDQKLSKYYTEPAEGTFANQLLNWEHQASAWLLPSNVEAGSTYNIVTGQQKLAQALNATVLSVRMTVPFVDMGIESKVGGFGVGLLSGGDYGKVVPNPRYVEGSTVFALAQAEGNPGHAAQQVLALQRPVPVKGLKFEVEKGAPRDGGGLVGALFGAAGVGSDKADFMVKIDSAALSGALVEAATPIFKDLAQTLVATK